MKKLVLLLVAGCSGAPFTVLPDLGDSGGGSENYQPPHEATDASEEFSFTTGHDAGEKPDVVMVTTDAATDVVVQNDSQPPPPVFCGYDSGTLYIQKCADAQDAAIKAGGHDDLLDCQQPDLSCAAGFCCDIECKDPRTGGNDNYLCVPQ